MRPLLVLLLVLGAAGALYIALNGGDNESDGTGAIVNEGGGAQPVDDDPEVVDLTGDGGGNARAGASDPAVGRLPDETRATVVSSGAGSETVRGRVVDIEGAGIADAEVVLTKYGMTNFLIFDPVNADRSEDLTTITNEAGHFLFEKVPPYDNYSIIVRHPDYSPHEEGQVRVEEGEQSEEPAIVLRPGVRLFGAVSDSGGNAVPGAKLSLGVTAMTGVDVGNDPNAMSAVSGAQGAYEFKNLASGNYVLTVSANGYGRISIQQLSVGGDEDLERNVVLEVASALGGRVVSTSGEAIDGAKVMAYSLGNQKNRTHSGAVTDETGEFLVQDIPDGSYTLRVMADGYETLPVPRVQSGEMSLMLEMVALPTVSGRVLDLNGQPVKKFTVQLRHGVQNSESSVRVEGTEKQFNSPDGSFKINCPRAGEFFVDAVAPSFAHSFSDPFTIEKGQNLPGVIVTMRKGGTIKGNVVDASGSPIKGAWVQSRDNRWTGSQFDISIMGFFPGVATERRVRTNDKGEFSIDTLTPTTYLIEVTHKAYSKTVRKDIAVAEGIETPVNGLTMFSGGTAAGTVRGPSGAPLPGAMVTMTLEALGTNDFPVSMQAKCDQQGKYSFDHVKAGTYWIHATRPIRGNSNPFGQGNDVTKTRRKISIAEGGNYSGEDFDISN